jgi:dTDP-glucose 4,6-dehydratase
MLVTGGLGFIGSHFIKKSLANAENDFTLFNLDNMSHGSSSANIDGVMKDPRYHFILDDINNISSIPALHNIDSIVNFAAETHVDRSISNPISFLNSNYLGTVKLLEHARKNDVKLFVQVSTDEVYGEASQLRSFRETDALHPGNPYSASKAGADLMVSSFVRTYGIKAVVTRCANNFGPNQNPEKLIPRSIIRILLSMPVYLYGDGKHFRDWIYVDDHVEAIQSIIKKGRVGSIYNISASNIKSNLEVVQLISGMIEKKKHLCAKITFTVDRPGHDRCYSIDSAKIARETGWKAASVFEVALEKTVDWYIKNTEWWQSLVDDSLSEPQSWRIKNEQLSKF